MSEAQAVAPDQTALPAIAQDRKEWAKGKPSTAELFRHAVKKSGRKSMELAREFVRLHLGPGKMTLPEYVQYAVYDTTRHSREDQRRFITNTLHWPITRACCDMSWQAATEDKWLCSDIFAGSGVPVPETLAVIDKTGRAFPRTRKIATAKEFTDFASSPDALPCFGKEIRGICSFGAFLIEEADGSRVRLKGEGWMEAERFMGAFVGDTPYLLQRLARNHGFFDRYTDSLATVRICILLADDGIKTPFAVLKLPSRKNLADSFWRPGNLACNLEPESGKVLTVRTKDRFGTTDHDAHPETGAPLLGETLPQWARVLDLVHKCAPIFQPVRYQSMDIAVTPDGPVLIEINTGGGFDLPQLASGRGFLTDEVYDFFRACGYWKT